MLPASVNSLSILEGVAQYDQFGEINNMIHCKDRMAAWTVCGQSHQVTELGKVIWCKD